MAKSDLKITFEIEPIVKLTCLNTSCVNFFGGYCNLKHLVIAEDHTCMQFKKKSK